jgi:hypothetical protein
MFRNNIFYSILIMQIKKISFKNDNYDELQKHKDKTRFILL